jgi:hypothetical protein
MQQFLVYEEYAANNEVLGECSDTLKENATWLDTELGIEALSSLTISMVNREADSHKALTFADLVIKVCSLTEGLITVLICESPSSAFASTLSFSRNCANTLQHAMTL